MSCHPTHWVTNALMLVMQVSFRDISTSSQ